MSPFEGIAEAGFNALWVHAALSQIMAHSSSPTVYRGAPSKPSPLGCWNGSKQWFEIRIVLPVHAFMHKDHKRPHKPGPSGPLDPMHVGSLRTVVCSNNIFDAYLCLLCSLCDYTVLGVEFGVCQMVCMLCFRC